MQDEETLYRDKDGYVTPSRFVVGPTTYAIAQITSVTVVSAPRNMAALGLGVPIAAVGGYIASRGDEVGLGLAALAVGALIVAGALVRRWVVAIGTSSGQVQALVSPDRTRIERIAAALNQAITSRR